MRSFLLFALFAFLPCYGNDAKTFPTPPQQQAVWSMPKGMDDPDGVIGKTVEHLFSTGMADPRGLPYHHVSVKEGEDLLEARGWVLPASDENQRYAIGWSGLIYPVAKIGNPADLKADLATLTTKGQLNIYPNDNVHDESLGDLTGKIQYTPGMMHPFAAPYLMLRLGYPIMLEAEDADPFAEQSAEWHEWRVPDYPHKTLAEFALLARDYGVIAWMDGDFSLAAERLRIFDASWLKAESLFPQKEEVPEANQEAIKDPFSGEHDDPFLAAWIALPELNGAWREILVDAKRRLSPRPKVEGSAIEKAIASWDQIDEWSEDNPPTSFRLVTDSGIMAIKPLLDCLENDQRWTRVVNLDEEYSWNPRIMRVRHLALLALVQVLEFHFDEIPNANTPAESKEYDRIAATYRTQCERYGYQRGPELWYRILQDPKSTREQQLMAVELMVTPFEELWNIHYHGFSATYGQGCCERSELTKPAESLRGKTKPSVVDLMKQVWQRERERVDGKLENGESESPISFPVCGHVLPVYLRTSTHQIVHYMEDWSPGNTDVLRSHYRWLFQGLKNAHINDNLSVDHLLDMCEQTLIRRYGTDDDTVVKDYEELLRTSIPHGTLPVQFLLVASPSDQTNDIIADAFLGENAPLSFIEKAWENYDPRGEAIAWDSPLLKLPAYRKALIEALLCTEVQATLMISPENAELLFHSSEDKESQYISFYEGLLGRPNSKSSIDIRVCDLVAYHLTPGLGYKPWRPYDAKEVTWMLPDFHLDDTIEQRDKAIAKWIKLLKNYR